MRWLILDLEAPLLSFGAEAVDGLGRTRDFPSASALTGLLGNALGYERTAPAPLDALQARLVFGARINPVPDAHQDLRDFQTARLGKDDKGWTTYGVEQRGGGPTTYDNPILRERHYIADASLTVCLRLTGDERPSLDDLATAIDRPARPLFIGRKPCLPASRLFGGMIEAGTVVDALRTAPLPQKTSPSDRPVRAQWSFDETSTDTGIDEVLRDVRSFRRDVHQGARRVMTGEIVLEDAT